ncbi:TonB-dependent receptor [Dyadobacter psychrotolerans]|uniref:TonB-dependent receptor n=1 Tax=Dyadobacter psychrotolerans TaxID=2541721 RepID=A0A4R5DHM5_9BACT|nr:TonB-dependent receptor [Dyadobacter psychrotolerans]TDE11374.1 TonB-dependent receptor [Dyadobacter psychrotolerans]
MQKLVLPLVVLFSLVGFSVNCVFAQSDTLASRQLKEVTINAFESRTSPLTTTATVGLLTSKTLDRFASTTWTSAVNAIAGVRMEERSPGSYRFSIRGSMLRSPFGIRNVKFYWNGIPFTDAGGNTPLNSLDYGAVQSMQIIKGPGSSLYGAGTGGVVLLQSSNTNDFQNRAEQSVGIGKYGFQNRSTNLQIGGINIQYGHTEQDGYRNHSAMGRDAIRFSSTGKLGEKGTISLLGMYSDIHYQTPGGLNFAQYQLNPKLARPSTATVAGSEAQKVGIYTKLAMLGGNYMLKLSDNWTQSNALYLTTTDFANPFIANYEKRDEQGVGGRNIWQNTAQLGEVKTSWTSGFEWQYSKSAQRNYDNKGGIPDKQQTVEDIRTTTLSVFSQLEAVLFKDLTATVGLSYNTFRYKYERFFVLPYTNEHRDFDGVLVPRIAINKVIARTWAVTASYSSGFSPPTLQEVRPSAGGFRKDLNAEKGINTEIGLRKIDKNFTGEVSLYSFGLRETIVRRTDDAGSEFFINAGKTRQNGLEWNLSYDFLTNSMLPLTFRLWNSGTWTKYTFQDFAQGETNLSGNLIPGIPRFSQSTGVDVLFKYGFSVFATYQHGGFFYLNDANTVKNTPYNQWTGRASWKKSWGSHLYSELSVSAEKVNAGIYSLGYDLNAFGNRYYNASPKDNLWAGVKLGWEWGK